MMHTISKDEAKVGDWFHYETCGRYVRVGLSGTRKLLPTAWHSHQIVEGRNSCLAIRNGQGVTMPIAYFAKTEHVYTKTEEDFNVAMTVLN